MAYIGLVLDNIKNIHHEHEMIARAQRNAMDWDCMRKKRRRVIGELEQQRQEAERMLESEVFELLFLLGMLSDDGQVQCHDERLRGVLTDIAGEHGAN